MPELIAWCAFAGGWLLVAGPIYQAAIELADEEFDRDELRKVTASYDPPPHVSAWWLLLPPVAYALHVRRQRASRRAVKDLLSADQLEQLMHFSEMATAWLFVASGAFLIAVKETWELAEQYEWPTLTFWILVVAMIAISTTNTAVRMRRRNAILAQARG